MTPVQGINRSKTLNDIISNKILVEITAFGMTRLQVNCTILAYDDFGYLVKTDAKKKEGEPQEMYFIPHSALGITKILGTLDCVIDKLAYVVDKNCPSEQNQCRESNQQYSKIPLRFYEKEGIFYINEHQLLNKDKKTPLKFQPFGMTKKLLALLCAAAPNSVSYEEIQDTLGKHYHWPSRLDYVRKKLLNSEYNMISETMGYYCIAQMRTNICGPS